MPFVSKKLTFLGFVFSADGVSPDPQKVAVIKNAPPPRSVRDVHTFLGMVTYCSKFIQNFSDNHTASGDFIPMHAR